ncbi:plasmid mobilization protein [Stenomitos frigidus]|uniref:Bacterial mobilisation domain-containing protein n=1 Tax=Stenomitos frigidus ULC18 TaxID=2107698 RepID=A0A2T1EMD3_9CYAN|nr:hypothetical protein [Stenomitos frigidus]PSB33909.1 hypothetical protein C7B82_03325 [Stenomitos frigidus ULC18]
MLDPESKLDHEAYLTALEQLMAPVLPPLLATERLSCRVPSKEHQALKVWCKAQGLPLSDYVRARLYDQPLPKRPHKERVSPLEQHVLVALNRLGNNLNQTVRRLYRQEHPSLNEVDRELLQTIQAQLKDIQRQLRTE